MSAAVVLLTATAFEQRRLLDRLEKPVRQEVAARPWHRGRLAGREVLVVEGGIGAVNTAHALTCVLQALRPGLVLQAGVGGAYLAAGLEKGDVVLASEENYGDLGVRTREGWQPAELIGIPVLPAEQAYFNRFPLDEALVAQALRVLASARAGPFVTVQECSGLASLGAERAARFGALCENMEGAAAAHLCRLYQVPFLEVRAISNQVEDRAPQHWDLPLAGGRAQEAALHLVEGL